MTTLNFTINEEPKNKPHTQDFIPSFIRKTYDILEEARFPQFIDWSADGTAIVIKKPSEFSQKVLPVYFKHNNFTSFVRQLNMYNFHKRRSQTLDHIYIHELFQKGKRHLLQEIKRKVHDHPTEKAAKVLESREVSNSSDEASNLYNENQFLKRLYTEAMNRLATLENQAKELAAQNQNLWNQVHNKNGEKTTFAPNIMRFESQSELTLDQLPMTLGKIALNFSGEDSITTPPKQFASGNFGQFSTAAKISEGKGYAASEESSGMSTLSSRNSPVINSESDSEEYNRLPSSASAKSNFFQFSQVGLFPSSLGGQGGQGQSLNVNRQEMSVGRMLETWNFEVTENDDLIYFSDQKTDNYKPSICEEKSLLGKRPFNHENQLLEGEALEPSMKRVEMCACMMKSGIDGVKIEAGFGGIRSGYELQVGANIMDF